MTAGFKKYRQKEKILFFMLLFTNANDIQWLTSIFAF